MKNLKKIIEKLYNLALEDISNKFNKYIFYIKKIEKNLEKLDQYCSGKNNEILAKDINNKILILEMQKGIIDDYYLQIDRNIKELKTNYLTFLEFKIIFEKETHNIYEKICKNKFVNEGKERELGRNHGSTTFDLIINRVFKIYENNKKKYSQYYNNTKNHFFTPPKIFEKIYKKYEKKLFTNLEKDIDRDTYGIPMKLNKKRDIDRKLLKGNKFELIKPKIKIEKNINKHIVEMYKETYKKYKT